MKKNLNTLKQHADSGGRKSLIIILLSGLFISSCDDLLSTEEQAEKAAAEICECIKNNSLSTCKDKLNDEYGHYANDDDFIKAFNNAQGCGITIYKDK